MSTMAIRRLPPYANLEHSIVWIDDWLKRCLHEAIGDLTEQADQRVLDACFIQDRYPQGVQPHDVKWAKEVYFERLARGCLMQSMILGETGLPGPLSDAVYEVVLQQRQRAFTDRYVSQLRSRLVAAASRRMKDVGLLWLESDYARPMLAEWLSSFSSQKCQSLLRSVAADAIAYLRLVSNWAVYRDAIELLTPEDAHWLFARVDSVPALTGSIMPSFQQAEPLLTAAVDR